MVCVAEMCWMLDDHNAVGGYVGLSRAVSRTAMVLNLDDELSVNAAYQQMQHNQTHKKTDERVLSIFMWIVKHI